MAKALKTPQLSAKSKDKLLEHPPKPSATESTITRHLRSLKSYINFSEPGPSTLTHSPAPSSPSIRADNPETQIPIPYARPIISLPEPSIFFTLLFS